MIYKLNDSMYSKMPPVFHLDDYDNCLINPKGVYCTANVDIVSDTSSELLAMIRNYSEYGRKHFNHSQLHYGICVTHTCRYLYADNRTHDLKLILEKCLNDTLLENYQLKCRISEPVYCNSNESTVYEDTGDVVMAAFLIILLVIDCISTLYDFLYFKRHKVQGNKYVLCFSILRNYSKLTTSYKGLNVREERLKSLHGLRTLTMMGVIFCHSLLPFALAPENPHYVEMVYDNISHLLFLNGMIVVQTFFIISGCLLAYKLELYAESHVMKWTLIPRGIISTWVKLTPSYAIVLALTCTWLRHAGSGPFWELTVTKEVKDCRTNGWRNLLYINNYFDNTQCMVQSWYLGAIMQMYILGYMACVLTKSKRRRKMLLISLFLIGVVTPAAHTYFQDLDAMLIVTPETARTFEHNPTFNNVYKRGHTNLVNFVVGLALGSFVYRLQVDKIDMERFKKFRFLLLLTFPGILMSIFIGTVFYMDGSEASPLAKAIYAGTIKPLYGLIIATLIFGCVFKIDNVYRVILEWDGWKIPSKLSYCAFLLHFMLIRAATGMRKTLLPLNYYHMVEVTVTFVTLSFVAAIPFWILIDAPLTELMKLCLKLTNTEKETVGIDDGEENVICLNKRNDISVDDNDDVNA
ncbi:nose resistant to fluoxetine protein 6-like [Melitaea cinxia]|uniref:nose resistant to fluoxetine protein 6-like n=1 Tax=Melitaea cinxia TaxID=113334 RepID=UPI001E272770|nr:nose resistant to fluoxetine protein 6-like [Melitaea cinxia]